MIGVVDVGDGMRGAFGAGVLDYCLENGINFDECVGVSSGASNLAGYVAGQKGWSYRYYSSHSFRPASMSWFHKLRNHDYYNLEYIYTTLAKQNGEDPLDFDAILESEKQFQIMLTDADIGEAITFEGQTMRQDDYGLIKASWCTPGLNTNYFWAGYKMCDGAIADPIPVKAALNDGCEKVVVILTMPRNYYRGGWSDRMLARHVRYEYPDLAHVMNRRFTVYNQQLEECKAMEKDGRVLIVAPQSMMRMSSFSRDSRGIRALYLQGQKAAAEVRAFLEK